jgi:TonB family protein
MVDDSLGMNKHDSRHRELLHGGRHLSIGQRLGEKMRKVFWAVLGLFISIGTSSFVQAQSTPSFQSGADGVAVCPASFEFHPEKDGVYDLSSGVKSGTITLPKLTKYVEPEFTDEARRQSNVVSNFRAKAILSLIVDNKGKPGDMCVSQSAPYGLDKQAMKAASKFRFEPAKREGIAVAVRVKIEVNFIRVY